MYFAPRSQAAVVGGPRPWPSRRDAACAALRQRPARPCDRIGTLALTCLQAPTFWPDNASDTAILQHNQHLAPCAYLHAQYQYSRQTAYKRTAVSLHGNKTDAPAVKPLDEARAAQAITNEAHTHTHIHHGRLYFQIPVVDLGEEGDKDIDSGTCMALSTPCRVWPR